MSNRMSGPLGRSGELQLREPANAGTIFQAGHSASVKQTCVKLDPLHMHAGVHLGTPRTRTAWEGALVSPSTPSRHAARLCCSPEQGCLFRLHWPAVFQRTWVLNGASNRRVTKRSPQLPE